MKYNGFASVLLLVWAAAFAQTEDDLLRRAQESIDLLAAGKHSELQHYKQVYKLVSEMPASYRQKSGNMKMLDATIDIWEAEAAGKITREKALRLTAQQNAQAQDQEVKKDNDEQRATRLINENNQAQEDAQRRAIALQMLQGNRFSPYQGRPYIPPPTINCRTVPAYGGGFTTQCN